MVTDKTFWKVVSIDIMAVNHQMSLSLSTDYNNFNACLGVENTANHFTKFCLLEGSGLLGCDAVIGQRAPDVSKDCSASIFRVKQSKNNGHYSPNNKTSRPTRLQSSVTRLWESQISHSIIYPLTHLSVHERIPPEPCTTFQDQFI
jgi:hypothetical protein